MIFLIPPISRKAPEVRKGLEAMLFGVHTLMRFENFVDILWNDCLKGKGLLILAWTLYIGVIMARLGSNGTTPVFSEALNSCW